VRIEITTGGDDVTVAAIEHNTCMTTEIVLAKGKTLTEALENLMVRFSELRQLALQELRAKEFVRTEKATEQLS
jgi:hypothetical protein